MSDVEAMLWHGERARDGGKCGRSPGELG